jgi:hypothetical protein
MHRSPAVWAAGEPGSETKTAASTPNAATVASSTADIFLQSGAVHRWALPGAETMLNPPPRPAFRCCRGTNRAPHAHTAPKLPLPPCHVPRRNGPRIEAAKAQDLQRNPGKSFRLPQAFCARRNDGSPATPPKDVRSMARSGRRDEDAESRPLSARSSPDDVRAHGGDQPLVVSRIGRTGDRWRYLTPLPAPVRRVVEAAGSLGLHTNAWPGNLTRLDPSRRSSSNRLLPGRD